MHIIALSTQFPLSQILTMPAAHPRNTTQHERKSDCELSEWEKTAVFIDYGYCVSLF